MGDPITVINGFFNNTGPCPELDYQLSRMLFIRRIRYSQGIENEHR